MTEKKLLKRISKCFKRSVNAATTGDPLMLALRRFEEGLRVAIAAADTPEIALRMAIAKNKNGRGVDEFTVHVKELFSKWFDDQRHLAAVLRWLNNEGLLEVRDRDAAVREGFTIESVRLTRRIQGKNCATVVFRDPRPRLKQVLGSYAPFPAALPIIKP